MENKYTFTAVAVIAIIGAFFGISLLSPNLYNSQSSTSFFASAMASVNFGNISTSDSLLTSFDNFENIHRVVLDKNKPLKISGIYKGENGNTFWTTTDRGMFLSRDGGLTWNSFASSNNEITKNTKVFSVIQTSSNGRSFIVSTFTNGIGSVYETNNSFFNLYKLIDFKDEVPYSMYKYGNLIYFGMSNGQIIRYNLLDRHMKVVGVMNEPITRILRSKYGEFYITLSSGKLFKSDSLESKFNRIKVPGNTGLFSIWGYGSKIKDIELDNGNIFVVSNDKILVSYNNGKSFNILKTIPITREDIHTLSVRNGIIRAISDNRMLSSSDGGDTWVAQDISGSGMVNHIYFVGGRIFLGR